MSTIPALVSELLSLLGENEGAFQQQVAQLQERFDKIRKGSKDSLRIYHEIYNDAALLHQELKEQSEGAIPASLLSLVLEQYLEAALMLFEAMSVFAYFKNKHTIGKEVEEFLQVISTTLSDDIFGCRFDQKIAEKLVQFFEHLMARHSEISLPTRALHEVPMSYLEKIESKYGLAPNEVSRRVIDAMKCVKDIYYGRGVVSDLYTCKYTKALVEKILLTLAQYRARYGGAATRTAEDSSRGGEVADKRSHDEGGSFQKRQCRY